MDPALRALAARLPHDFSRPELLETALNHRSAAFEAGAARRGKAPPDNERLEFLGDAVLSLCVSELLWKRLPQAREGELTRLRAAVVNEAALIQTMTFGAIAGAGIDVTPEEPARPA